MEYLGRIMAFSLVSLQKLSAPANETSLKEAHQKVLSELADICRSDDSNHSHAIALVKGLRFVLLEIQVYICFVFVYLFIHTMLCEFLLNMQTLISCAGSEARN